MVQIFPFFAWLAAGTSVVLIIVLGRLGDLRRPTLWICLAWFAVAAYCQFLGDSTVVVTTGLVLQTILAVLLLIRWKLDR